MTIDMREGASAPRSEDRLDPISPSNRANILAELNDLLASRHFKASRRCSDFLQYAVRQVLEGQVHSLKERSLGAQLFGRAAGYDTNSDPVVRATAGEIRKKLAQHYQESSSSSVRILLPVGSYVPLFQIEREAAGDARPNEAAPPPAARAQSVHPAAPSIRKASGKQRFTARKRWLAVFAGAAIVACLLIFNPGLREIGAVRGASRLHGGATAIASFWAPFVADRGDTVVVFSSLGQQSQQHMLDGVAYHSGISTGDIASPGISGVGEVMGVHALDGVFASLHRSLWAKRSNFFSFDDAAHENVIFLGSPLANSPLRLLQSNGDFVFQMVTDPEGKPALAILNHRPRPNEPRKFFATAADSPIKQDYAVIALLPGMLPGNKVLILAGITTFGTQAAAEFVSRDSSLKTLLAHLKATREGQIQPFEALVSVKIDDEVPVQETVLAVHQN